MNEEVWDTMKWFDSRGYKILKKGEESYSVVTDQLDYFPKGWDSVYTYINENLLRLDNLYNGDVYKHDKIEDKWIDLLNYVKMGYAVIRIRQFGGGYIWKKRY